MIVVVVVVVVVATAWQGVPLLWLLTCFGEGTVQVWVVDSHYLLMTTDHPHLPHLLLDAGV